MRHAVTVRPGMVVPGFTPDPVPAAGEVVVSVDAVGICGSDVHIFEGTHPYRAYPVVQGHEIAGTIEVAGGGRYPVGTPVVVEPLVSCGRCFACRRGRYNACASLEVLGVHRAGGLAELLVVPAGRVHPIGDLEPTVAVLCEPVAVAVEAVSRATPEPGDRVVMIGAGSIGRAIAMVATDAGARVLVADREPSRLDLAVRLGAERAVDTTREDLVDAVLDFTDGEGAGSVLEATGVPVMVRSAIDLVAPTGSVVIVGVSDDEVCVPVSVFTRKELRVLGSRNSADRFDEAIRLVRRHRSELAGAISHRYPLAETQQALEAAARHPHLVTKAVVEPQSGDLAEVGLLRATAPVSLPVTEARPHG